MSSYYNSKLGDLRSMSQVNSEIRVRFAPSPTGNLHVGGARTALFNYLFAKRNKGKFILRIEDTDQARSTEESLRIIINDLLWLGLKWDEGPNPQTLEDDGPFGSYYQSKRLSVYAEHAQKLLNDGKAYYCFLTDAEMEAQREQATQEARSLHINSPYEDWSLERALEHKRSTGTKAVVRFKTKHLKKDYIFNDLIRGEIKFPSDMVGDFVLLRSDGMPVYNFCCVIDDYLMKITHVLRAEEHLPNTLRQLMIYEALNAKAPEFGHMSLILNEERQKLSKRHGAVSCAEFRDAGFLPQCLNNFMALLGWSSPEGKEIMSMDEMKTQFSLDRLNPAGAIFDIKKFRWMNSVYLRALDDKTLWSAIYPFLKEAELELPTESEWQERSVQVFKTSMEVLKDAVELYQPISDKHFIIGEEAREVFPWETTVTVLKAWKTEIETFPQDYLQETDFLNIQDKIKNQYKVNGKHLFMPIRVAVIGKPHGKELKILVPLLKKSSLLNRVNKVLEKCI
jgi:nondiscriminating glutamyl-tRNA synthetase